MTIQQNKETTMLLNKFSREQKVQAMTAITVYAIYCVFIYGILSIIEDIFSFKIIWLGYICAAISVLVSYWDFKTK